MRKVEKSREALKKEKKNLRRGFISKKVKVGMIRKVYNPLGVAEMPNKSNATFDSSTQSLLICFFFFNLQK